MTREQLEAVWDALVGIAGEWNRDDGTGTRNDFLCLTLADDGSGRLGRRSGLSMSRVEDFHDFDDVDGLVKVLRDAGVEVRDDASDLAVAEKRLAEALRRASAAEAKLEAVLKLNPAEMDRLLERWDLTAPDVQRGVVAAFAGRLVLAQDENARLRAVVASADLRRLLGEGIDGDLSGDDPDTLKCLLRLRQAVNEALQGKGG